MLEYYNIIRPLTCFFVFLLTYLGSILSKNNDNFILLVLQNIFTMGSINTINDIFDYKLDKIIFPNRPLTSGRMSYCNAVIYYIITTIII